MAAGDAVQGDIESPCIDVCEIGPGDLCLGCYRTLAEIAAWSALDDEDKRRVIAAARARRSAAPAGDIGRG